MGKDGGGDGGFQDWEWDSAAEKELQAIEATYCSSFSAATGTKRQLSSDIDAEDPEALDPGRRLPRWGWKASNPLKRHALDNNDVVRGTDGLLPASYPSNGASSVLPLPCPGSINFANLLFFLFSKQICYCGIIILWTYHFAPRKTKKNGECVLMQLLLIIHDHCITWEAFIAREVLRLPQNHNVGFVSYFSFVKRNKYNDGAR